LLDARAARISDRGTEHETRQCPMNAHVRVARVHSGMCMSARPRQRRWGNVNDTQVARKRGAAVAIERMACDRQERGGIDVNGEAAPPKPAALMEPPP